MNCIGDEILWCLGSECFATTIKTTATHHLHISTEPAQPGRKVVCSSWQVAVDLLCGWLEYAGPGQVQHTAPPVFWVAAGVASMACPKMGENAVPSSGLRWLDHDRKSICIYIYIYFYSLLGKSSNFLWISNWENHPRSGFSSLDPIRSAIELMKQKQDYGHWYDRQKILVKDIGNTQRPGTK